MSTSPAPLLAVRDLSVRYREPREPPVEALDAVGFDVAPGEAVGILGESGCGKTTLALAVLGLLPPAGEIARGSIRFRESELVGADERRLEPLRGAEIGLVSQEPALALHPTMRVGRQIVEVIRAHRTVDPPSVPRPSRRWGRGRMRAAAHQLLAAVGLDEGVYGAYPHQLSGGQRQRIVIAQALAGRPALVIADEPTAALDATTQARILALLRRLKERFRTAFLYVSHDPRVLAEMADRLLVMYAGRVVEEGPSARVLGDPLHPYSVGLLGCLPPPPGAAPDHRALPAIPGSAPVLRELEPGCRFAPRCPEATSQCRAQDPRPCRPGAARTVWCWRRE